MKRKKKRGAKRKIQHKNFSSTVYFMTYCRADERGRGEGKIFGSQRSKEEKILRIIWATVIEGEICTTAKA